MEGESPNRASSPAGAVFLSYASEDLGAAERLAANLREAGIEVWFDRSELRGGDAWDRQIRKQIHDCALFVPIISAHADARREGYFRREWKLAVERTADMAEDVAFLLPVAIDGTPDATARVPDRFRDVQWSRLPNGQPSPAFIERVQRLLSPARDHGEESHAARPLLPDATARTQRSVPEPSRSKLAVAVTIALIVFAGVAYFLGDKLWSSRRAASTMATAQSPAAREKSIVVLPFADMSEKHDQEYFSDGMAEELIDRLTQIPELRVISRTSAFQFKGKSDDVRAIGQRLAVANVLEGSVRRSGDRLRIDVKLVSVSDSSQRWSQRYDRPISDVLKIQDEIAGEVVLALKARLIDSSSLGQAMTQSEAAHNLLLEGRFFMERWEPGDPERAASKYQQALNEDPTYALAWSELAWAYMWTTPQNYAGCASAARRAVEVGPNLASAHATRGWCESLLGFDWALGDAEFDKALALEPHNARALYGKGRLARALGRIGDAVRYYQAVLERDPVNTGALLGFSFTLVTAQRPAEAVQQARRALDLSPNAEWGHYYLAYALLLNNQLDEALRESALEPVGSMRFACQALIARVRGDRQAQDAALRALLASEDPYKRYFAAQVYAASGDAKSAIDWLERARLARIGWFSEFNSDPAFDGVRKDPTFVEYLRRVNLTT